VGNSDEDASLNRCTLPRVDALYLLA